MLSRWRGLQSRCTIPGSRYTRIAAGGLHYIQGLPDLGRPADWGTELSKYDVAVAAAATSALED